MLARDFIEPDYPVLAPEDPIHKAMDFFLDTCYCHFPIVSEELAMGIFPSDILVPNIDKGQTVADFREDWLQVVALQDQHAIEVIQLFGKFDVSAIPVVDEKRTFLGVITSATLLQRLSELQSFSEMGGIIVLTMGIRDYNLTEIARIVQTNNHQILMLYLNTDEVNGTITVTIKINTPNLRHILATFERFNYQVDFFYPSNAERDELTDRYNLLMKLFDL